MHNLAICVKSYGNNLDLFSTLANSIEINNVAQIPIVIICPTEDVKSFETIMPNATIITEEELVPKSKSIRGLSEGYVIAEICKLHFYKLKFAKNVLFVDDDSKFIRNFTKDDFFDIEGNLYTVLTQDKDLLVDPSYTSYSAPRQRDLLTIYKTLGVNHSRLLQVQMNALVSCAVLEELNEEALPSLGLDAFSALELSPFEYNWYTVWLQKSKLIPIVPIEPLFKTFHVREQYIASLSQGISESEISNAYIGVIYNSSWYRNYLLENKVKRYYLDITTDKYYLRHVRQLKRFFRPIR